MRDIGPSGEEKNDAGGPLGLKWRHLARAALPSTTRIAVSADAERPADARKAGMVLRFAAAYPLRSVGECQSARHRASLARDAHRGKYDEIFDSVAPGLFGSIHWSLIESFLLLLGQSRAEPHRRSCSGRSRKSVERPILRSAYCFAIRMRLPGRLDAWQPSEATNAMAEARRD